LGSKLYLNKSSISLWTERWFYLRMQKI
jgi:hypothetical protein